MIGRCWSRDRMLVCDWSAAGQAAAVRAEQDGPQLLLRRRGHGEGQGEAESLLIMTLCRNLPSEDSLPNHLT